MNKNNYHLVIDDLEQLEKTYLPFIKQGGLFVKSEQPHRLDDEITLNVGFLQDKETYPISGKVVWINPESQGDLPQGIGIQVEQDAKSLIKRIHDLIS